MQINVKLLGIMDFKSLAAPVTTVCHAHMNKETFFFNVIKMCPEHRKINNSVKDRKSKIFMKTILLSIYLCMYHYTLF